LGEFTGIDDYMEIKVKAAQLIEPGSVKVLSAIDDESNALIMVTFILLTFIALRGPGRRGLKMSN
jgi:hypothetical protein